MNDIGIILEGIPALPLGTRCYNKPGGGVWVCLLGGQFWTCRLTEAHSPPISFCFPRLGAILCGCFVVWDLRMWMCLHPDLFQINPRQGHGKCI